MANLEGEDLLSNRLHSFMANGDQSTLNSEAMYHLTGQTSELLSSTLGLSEFSAGSPVHLAEFNSGAQDGFNSGISCENMACNDNDSSTKNNGVKSDGCSGPISGLYANLNTPVCCEFLSQRSTQVPQYSTLTSPCITSKITPVFQQSLLNVNDKIVCSGSDRLSLQNSPFYNNYSGNLHSQLRQFSGVSPGSVGSIFSKGASNLSTASPNFNRSGLYQDAAFSLPGFRSTNSSGCCLQRELFPSIPSSHSSTTNTNFVGSGLLMQDRLYYYGIAQRHGFIVGSELERIKENSRRSTSQSYGRISAYFRNRYGETEAKTKAAYLQLGVRVPSKDHVSEIVGKGGKIIYWCLCNMF